MGGEQSVDAGDGRRFVPPGRRSGHPQLDFPPVRNGIDYLASVVEHLYEEESAVEPRDLKYAVLHLQAAAEVLLKARLLREHWSLVFKDPGKATRKDFDSADFESCGTGAAVERLRDIVGINFEKKETEALDALAKDRNALQHYGLTHNAHAVEARAGRVLDFLLRFLEDELLPLLDGREREMAAREMIPVSDGVRNISSFVTRRLNRLRGELKGQQSLTLQCPDCEQMTLVVVPGGGVCHFCSASWSSDESIASDYLEAHGETEELIQLCPQCDDYALVEGVVFADDPTAAGALYCFGCTARYTAGELISCAGCSRLWPVEADEDGGADTLCPECREQTQPESVG
ncbi:MULTISPECIES: hypothetical protein [unclassified Streptomyces]|uniref:hypothetical protein n=1 Tax=unclassified Streptomyces TaxID=2593676 RepID=UPI0034156CE7